MKKIVLANGAKYNYRGTTFLVNEERIVDDKTADHLLEQVTEKSVPYFKQLPFTEPEKNDTKSADTGKQDAKAESDTGGTEDEDGADAKADEPKEGDAGDADTGETDDAKKSDDSATTGKQEDAKKADPKPAKPATAAPRNRRTSANKKKGTVTV